MRLNRKEEMKCENCGAPLNEGEVYARDLNGATHYFCCSHCADDFERKSAGATCC
ncbi:transcriptional regulator [Sulfodiicoccus acidiphilus]|nr:transcriptional regulator [Sulfodiicoccus acidiphilus]